MRKVLALLLLVLLLGLVPTLAFGDDEIVNVPGVVQATAHDTDEDGETDCIDGSTPVGSGHLDADGPGDGPCPEHDDAPEDA